MYELNVEDVSARYEELVEKREAERYENTLDNIISSTMDAPTADHVIYTGDDEQVPPLTWGKVVKELSVSVEFEANSPYIDDDFHIVAHEDNCQFFTFD